jgi:hypothetical protein
MNLPTHLVDSSSLTVAQIESLTAYHRVVLGQLTLKRAAEARQPRSVRIGSFYRTVQQGRKNISASVVTLTIALWLGFVKPDELRRLLDQVGSALPDVEQFEVERLATVVEELADRIVM